MKDSGYFVIWYCNSLSCYLGFDWDAKWHETSHIHDMTPLIFIIQMKFWGKAHDVNSPKDQTMSSMSIISLVAFHLQVNWYCYFWIYFLSFCMIMSRKLFHCSYGTSITDLWPECIWWLFVATLFYIWTLKKMNSLDNCTMWIADLAPSDIACIFCHIERYSLRWSTCHLL